MIVVRLIGGLGNQMFQYAAGKSLAERLSTELFLDSTYLERPSAGAYTKREFELEPFRIQARIADQKVLSQFRLNQNPLWLKLKCNFPSLFANLVFNESGFTYNRKFDGLPDNSYLNGYWQSEKYFLEIRDQLLYDFSLKQDLSNEGQELQRLIRSVNSVSLHVRRGDYVNLAAAANYHGVLEVSYYKKAIEYLTKKVSDPHYFIFSDDIAWCRSNFDFIDKVIFVEGKKYNISSQEELLLMCSCRNNIIANSSFSWWAAWLNQNQDKVVIAPSNWFKDKNSLTRDLYPSSWKKI